MAKRKTTRRSTSASKKKKENSFWSMVAIGIIAVLTGSYTGLFKKTDGKTTTTDSASHITALDNVSIPSSLSSQIKDYEGFKVSFNKDNGTPNWVSWELLRSETQGNLTRSDNFWQDNDLIGCPQSSDYSRSGYDRGHMCPAADQKWSSKAMNDCFVMSNMCPQAHALNAGAWSTLESKERQWAQRDSAIIIVAGPIYESTDRKTIGAAGVRVPSAFFKVLLAPYLDEPRAIGFVYPNMSAPGNMQNYAMSVDEVEKLTGFDFFAALPDDIENKVESRVSFNEWNKSK
ncbi:MAG: DNA/RNA non-specific endonuclease [Muribaculaceae bacterium]|nr:DNA/RNA non-specific endonuclease [Muribaculaceae bacterium]MDE7189860.1 DNA/RNA non-specific endonuclease [Muribaculaceae bacterium]